jgi:hypothetical protein
VGYLGSNERGIWAEIACQCGIVDWGIGYGIVLVKGRYTE